MSTGTPVETPAADKPPRLEIVRADDAHAAAIAEFIREVWTPTATADSVLAARRRGAEHNDAEPGVPPPTWLALRAGRVLGYVTTIPVRWWDGQREWPAYWIKGLMVLPEYRNGPVGHAVMKAAAASLPRSAGLAVAMPARRLFGALGYSDLGAIPNFIRPLSAGRMLSRLELTAIGIKRLPNWTPAALRVAQATGIAAVGGWVAGAVLRAAAFLRRHPAARQRCDMAAEAPTAAELDGLWMSARDGFPTGVVRDGRYLRGRYPTEPDGSYVWLLARRQGVLTGVAILRRPRADGDLRLHGIRVATVADMLYQMADTPACMALLGGAERAARGLNADAVLVTGSCPALHRVLRRQCYFPIGGNVHLLLRDVEGSGARLADSLSDWWLTRGDGNSDEGL